jgi:hypothetical protein
MDMIADRIIATRAETWEDTDEEDRTLRRSLGVANLGGATLDNEENYCIKKLMAMRPRLRPPANRPVRISLPRRLARLGHRASIVAGDDRAMPSF